MGKRLTDYQKEERIVEKIVGRIKKLEKVYPSYLVERATVRYKNASATRRRVLKEKKRLEEELTEANRKLSRK